MKQMKKIINIMLPTVVAIFVPTDAYAYMDPGTGNALIYGIISLVGGGFTHSKVAFIGSYERKIEILKRILSIRIMAVS